MRILRALGAIWLLLSGSAFAQNTNILDTGAITAVSSGGACSAAPAGCAVFQLPNGILNSLTLQVNGTFTGTLLFEATSDGTNWFTITGTKLLDGSSSTGFASVGGTNTGQFSFQNSGILGIRVRATAWTSGTANITAVRGYAMARWLTPFFTTVTTSTGFLGPDGSCTAGAVPYSFTSDTDSGFYRIGADNVGACAGGTLRFDFNTTRLNLSSGYAIQFNAGASLFDEAANVIAQRNGTNAQALKIYKTFTDASNYERLDLNCAAGAADCQIITNQAGTGTSRILTVGTFGANDLSLSVNNTGRWTVKGTTGHFLAGADNTYDIGATNATRPRSLYLAGPAITVGSGTGITVNDSGSVRDLDYKVTIASTAFVCAAVTCDVTIGTLPADSHLVAIYAKLTTTFACASTCTSSTLSIIVGKGSGGSEYLASLDADAATGVFGDADAELGTLMTRAAAIQGGTYNTGSQVVVLRLTSGTGNIGNGSATNLSQGSVSITITTRVKA